MEHQYLHKHPLKLTDKGEEDGIVNCEVCREKLSGQIYACEPCRFFLHESCLSLPQQIQLFFHSCLLYLRGPFTYTCNACFRENCSAFAYRCDLCDFQIDVGCAQLPSLTSNTENERILHFSHRHPLQLFIEIDSKSFCRICEMLCLGPTWGCEQCLFQVHKSCLEILPQRIQPELHRSPFILLTSPSFFCLRCIKWSSDLNFRSISGRRHLCVNCGLVYMVHPDLSEPINHFFHPCPLVLKFSPFSTCNACFRNHSNFSYHCRICDFFLDFQCAQLTYEHEQLDYPLHFCHLHPLKTLWRIKDKVKCKLCEKFDSKPLLNCSQCDFYVHSSCIEILPQTTRLLPLNHTLVLLTIPSFTCTTCERACSGLTFYCRRGKLKFCAKCILWPENKFGDSGKFRSIHHWHQLTLRETNKIDEARCFLCGEYCFTSTYDCRECNACFHRSCAELPREIQHPIHLQHSLTLTSRSLLDTDANICCKLCLKNLYRNFSYNGIYHCEKCNLYLDTLCASCVTSIKYEGHGHLLSLVETMHGGAICQVCSTSCKGFASLRCAECDFNLHLLCGALPCTIKHKSHVHPLTLEDYYVEDNETDEFACHVCEEHRDPRLCVYRCAEGCLMICDVKCVISEVLKSLRGEYGVVELRTVHRQVGCELIMENLVFKKFEPFDMDEDSRDESLETKYVFSLDELLDSLPDFVLEETLGSEAWENENRPSLEEDEASLEIESSSAWEDNSSIRVEYNIHRENEFTYAYSREAFEQFTKNFYDSEFKRVHFPLLPMQHDGSRMAGDYSLPETLNSIYEKIFKNDKIIGANCKLSYPKKRLVIFLICSVFHEMHMTKVVDVTADRVRQWMRTFKLAEEKAGFEIGFMLEHIESIWKAHFLIKAKDLVDSKSSELHQQVEQLSELKEELRRKLRETEVKLGKREKEKEEHDAYRASGASNLKHEYKDALLIKWRYCYEPLAEYQKRISFGKPKELCPAGKIA